MVSRMVGRDVSRFFQRGHRHSDTAPAGQQPVLKVDGLVTPDHPNHSLSFQVSPGEIVGVAGLVGSGRTEMLQCLFGVNQPIRGKVQIDGETVRLRSPMDAIVAGLGLVPEDRKEHGLVIDFSVRANVSLANLSTNATAGLWINRKSEITDADENVQRLRIKTPHVEQVVRYLSGGNQQKVVIGKWLSMNPKVLLLDEPTRGIDIGAKEEIYRLMEKLASEGVAISVRFQRNGRGDRDERSDVGDARRQKSRVNCRGTKLASKTS